MTSPKTPEKKLASLQQWNDRRAILGSLAWLVLLFWEIPSEPFRPIIKLFLLAPWVMVPLGIRLAAQLGPEEKILSFYRFGSLLQPFAALFASLSFLLPPGIQGGLLTIPWLFFTLLMALWGGLRIFRGGLSSAPQTCFSAGLILLSIGGTGLALSRFGLQPFGFQEPIVLLVAVHFHFTAFVAPILAGAAGCFIESEWPAARCPFFIVALGVIATPLLIALGFIFSPLLKIVSVLILAASLCLLAVLQAFLLRKLSPWPAKLFLALSSASIFAGMILAVIYAWGELRGEVLVSIPEMAKTHGILNSLGFSLCGLLAWRIARRKEAP